MTSTRDLTTRLPRWFMNAAALLVAVAQLAFAVLPFAEARLGAGRGPHVEATSTAGHYTHDEARCAACQARTIVGIARVNPPLALFLAQPHALRAPTRTPIASVERSLTNSRAPPHLI